MRDAPAIVIGMAGATLLLGSLAPVAIEARHPNPAALAKGDRLAPSRPASERASVATIEIVGASRATVVFKGRDGTVLYRADPLEGTTLIAKNADPPLTSLKEEPIRPVVERPRPSREGSNPPPRNGRKPNTVGCETALSTLVEPKASRMPRLCLAQAPAAARS